jgi:hypothetical protein
VSCREVHELDWKPVVQDWGLAVRQDREEKGVGSLRKGTPLPAGTAGRLSAQGCPHSPVLEVSKQPGGCFCHTQQVPSVS